MQTPEKIKAGRPTSGTNPSEIMAGIYKILASNIPFFDPTLAANMPDGTAIKPFMMKNSAQNPIINSKLYPILYRYTDANPDPRLSATTRIVLAA